MQVISDLHIHSKYSRGCSKDLDIENIEKYSRQKGLDLVGTGDFQHPEWFVNLKKKLSETEAGSGIYQTKTGFNFILQTEISLIYTQDGKGRRIHQLILVPDFDTAEQVVDYLKKQGRIDYDGRPIFKVHSYELVESLKQISKDIEVIPAHIWTPWFALFGSNSGFDSIKDCFHDQLKHVHALETGLSSDPAMNWRLSQLDAFNMVSFSDSHSYWPWRIGRESTVFDLTKLTYKNIISALATKDRTEKNKISSTVEVDPSYGKYHEDGHRNCNIMMTPKEALKHKNICPVCRKPLTIGVHHRIDELADRPEGFKPANAIPFKTLIPLSEIIAVLVGKGIATRSVWTEYTKLMKLGSEFDVLLKIPEAKLAEVVHPKIAETIMLNREGKIELKPGYDGVYGVPLIKPINPRAEGKNVLDEDDGTQNPGPKKKQTSLGDF
ncbi:MAG: endonuclease Q family protein [Nanoarchaeota archaeon]|nr:endonuclease Q family protein [Nanoarchaeota archaeon]